MKYFEFGQENETLMVMLHDGGVCYKGVLPVAQQLAKEFHVVVVAYDGFNPSEPNTEFVSVMDEAKRLGDYIYQMTGKAGPIRKKLIAKLTGRKVEEAERLLYPHATWQSWKNQDSCLINRPTDLSVFKNTDMHIWHGINSQIEQKLAKDIRKWQDAGYAFTYKVFTNVGHGGLIAEHTEHFIEEVKAVHAASVAKKEVTCEKTIF